MAAKHRGTAAAARAACVDVLLLPVVQHKPAVAVNLADINAVLLEQVYKDFAAHQSEVAGKDKVEVGGGQTGVFKVGFYGVVGGRGKMSRKHHKIFEMLSEWGQGKGNNSRIVSNDSRFR